MLVIPWTGNNSYCRFLGPWGALYGLIFVWIPKYRKQILVGEVAEYAKEVFRRRVPLAEAAAMGGVVGTTGISFDLWEIK